MKILIVGGNGFIGKSLAAFLKSREYEVICSGFSKEGDIKIDARSTDSLVGLFQRQNFELVINLAGTFKDNFDVNICSSMNIVEALHLTGSDSRVIHVASATEQSSHKGIHESEYSLTKGKGTANFHRSLRSTGLYGATVVLHNTYGIGQPSDRFIAACITSCLSNLEFKLRYPNRVRDFVYQPDINLAFERVIFDLMTNSDKKERKIEIGTGLGHTMKEAAFIIAEILNCDDRIIKSANSFTEDPNPVRVASINPLDSYICKTSLQEGVKEIVSTKS